MFLKKYLKLFFLYSTGLFLILIVFIIFPFKKLIFIEINSTNFGSFFNAIDNYLNDFDLNQDTKKEKHILWFSSKKICNKFLEAKYKNKINIYNYNFFFEAIYKTLKLLKLKTFIYHIKSWYELEISYQKITPNKNFGVSFPTFINFNKNEKIEGLKILKKFGLKENDRWICVHNRDDFFKITMDGQEVENHHSHRNFNIQSLEGAIKYFTDKGFYVFRMGSNQRDKLNLKGDKIIDYSFSNDKSDFADIYLLSNCYLYFGSNSGTANPPITFKKYISYINFQPSHLNISNYLKTTPSIFKKLYCLKTKKLLSIKQLYENKLIGVSDSRIFDKLGYKHIDNTFEEITELAQEVIQTLDEEIKISVNEKLASDEYYKIINYYNSDISKGTKLPLMIGKKFLIKNLYLIS